MRIALSTIHASDNYGSVLQSHCLATALSAHGTVEVLDHRPWILNAGYLQDLLPYQPLRRRVNPQFVQFAAKHRRARRSWQSMLPLGRRVRGSVDAGDYADVDAVVIGSDEVWSGLWRAQPQFAAAAAPDRVRRIGYAVSAGRSTELPEWISSELPRFSSVLVRDANTGALCEAAGRTPEGRVCDPVMLVEPDHLRSLARAVPTPEDYVLVYAEHCRADARVTAAMSMAGAPNTIVSAGFPYPDADVRIAADAQEFVHLVARARLVVTSMFHGAVTALTLGVPVAILEHPAKRAKIDDLLDVVAPANLHHGDGFRLAGDPTGIEAIRASSSVLLGDALAGRHQMVGTH